MSEPELELVLPARAENVIVVRQAVAGLGEALGMSDRRVDDLKTVIAEACNNVVVHAYEGEAGPMTVAASADDEAVELTVSDEGRGFQPRAAEGGATLGLGLPLIASLSDSFEIAGAAGGGTTTKVSFALRDEASRNGTSAGGAEAKELTMAIEPGGMVRPVLARVIGALAARADFSMDRLSDTVLLGDAVSAHPGDDFAAGRVEVAIADGGGALTIRVGPLLEGGGERLLEQLRIPGEEGSLAALARSTEVVSEDAGEGGKAEFVVLEVAA